MRTTLILLLVVPSFLVANIRCNLQPPSINPTLTPPEKRLGECHTCRLLVESFNHGLRRTERGKFEGGDAAWEEEKLKNYRRSEVRLVELQEGLCKELKHYKDQCHMMAEIAEDVIEEWWFGDGSRDSNDLFGWLCVEKLRHCCPINHYGKDCKPCLGDVNNLCSGNGKCKGNGTRKGNGKCACDEGYHGENCETCSLGHWESYRDENKFLCSPCHKACKGGCAQGGTKGCTVCNPGWVFDSEIGCRDIDECLQPDVCKSSQFCVNGDGYHSCLDCDKSCHGCHGDGPDMCRRCAPNYSKKEGLCIRDSDEKDNHDKLTYSRYVTYLGLFIAFCIVLTRSAKIASYVGVLILSYAIVAEYFCIMHGKHNHPGFINMENLDLGKMFNRGT